MPEAMTIDRRQFQRAIELAETVIERRNAIPVLGAIKATANGAMVLESSDLDCDARVELPYLGKAADFILPDPRRLRSAIGASGAESIAITPRPSVDKEPPMIAIACGQLAADIRTMAPDDHPGAQRLARENFAADLGPAELAQIERVMRAVSVEDTRYYLNGICVSKVGDWLYRFAATDGHRLLTVDVPLPNATGTIPNGTIVPRRWLQIAFARFRKAKNGMRLAYGPKVVDNEPPIDLRMEAPVPNARLSLSAEFDGISFTLTTKLIDGTYPDYSRVIPQESHFGARVRKADLAQAIQALSALGTERMRAVKLTIARAGITCELKRPDLGNGRFRIPVTHYTGPDDFSIGMNGQYLLDLIAAFKGDEIQMAFTDSNAPVLVTDPADTAFQAVQMPMRV